MSRIAVPWWGKIAAKICLSRLGIGYGFWRRLGIFRHGDMGSSDYALEVFRFHASSSGFDGNLAGRTIVEIGPGDSIATALIAAAHGARAILVDSGAYANPEMPGILRMAGQLQAAGLPCPDLAQCRNLQDVLARCGARYLTQGLGSLRQLPDASVDLVFSHAVLEHIRLAEFDATMRECRRILRGEGRFSNRVDLQDHLGGGLNNLRFTERTWESDLFSRSGFYTNRIRFGDMLARFEKAGFTIVSSRPLRWESLPIRRRALARQFAGLPDEDLLVSGFDVLLR